MKFDNWVLIALLILFVVNCAVSQHKENTKNNKTDNKDNAKLIDKYRTEVAHIVYDKWDFPDTNKCDGELIASLVITILRNGEIQNLHFQKRSNCKEFDDSAYLAIKRAVPFKTFPIELKEGAVQIGLRFHPYEKE